MSEESWVGEIDDLRRRLGSLLERANLGAGTEEVASEALEELAVVVEELQAQNSELIESRNDLEAERERYRDLFETVPDGYVVTDGRGIMREVNATAAALFDRRRDLLIGKPLGSMIEAPDRRAFYAQLVRIQKQGPGSQLTINLRVQDGTAVPANLRATVATSESDNEIEIRWLIHDRRRDIAAREVRVSEERLRALFETAAVGIVLADADGGIAFSNQRAHELLGSNLDDPATPQDLLRGIPPEDRDAIGAALLAARRDGTTTIVRHRIVVHGVERWVDHGITAFTGLERVPHGAVSTLIDVTEEQQTRLELESSRDFTDAIVDTVGALVIVLSPDGCVERFNRACEVATGLAAQDVLGKPLLEALVPADQREQVWAVFEEVARLGTAAVAENDWVTAAGDRRSISWTNSALRYSDGTIRAIIGTGVDVTETRLLEARLAQADRLESIGRLAAGIAHDFNNTLSTLRLRIDRVARRTRSAATRADIAATDATIDRTQHVIADLVSFSRQQRLALQPTDINSEVERIADLLSELLGGSVSTVLDLSPDSVVAMVDPARFDQALTNLFINSSDAMPTGGTVTVTTGIDRFDPGTIPPGSGLSPGTYVRIGVADTGTGIDPLHASHIFDPYFTTKPPGKGTGLGLATTHGSVTQSGGAIIVDSAPGQGASFTIWLPEAGAEASDWSDPAAAGGAPRPESAAGIRSAIVVDDDDEMRNAVVEELSRLGYRTVSAATGKAALSYLPLDAELLVSDVQLPDIDGVEVARRFRARCPDLIVVFISGATPAKLAAVLPAGATALAKPFTIEQLETTIENTIR